MSRFLIAFASIFVVVVAGHLLAAWIDSTGPFDNSKTKKRLDELNERVNELDGMITEIQDIKHQTVMDYNLDRIKKHAVEPVFSLNTSSLENPDLSSMYLEVTDSFVNNSDLYLVAFTYSNGKTNYFRSDYLHDIGGAFSPQIPNYYDSDEGSHKTMVMLEKISFYKIQPVEVRYETRDAKDE